MAIFPVLETEDRVQISDKTRISCAGSFVAGTSNAITNREIKPGAAETYISVTSAQFLDWQFAFTVDIGTTNNKINFKESGAELTATLTSGNYTLATLATEIQTQMTSAGGTYTVTVLNSVYTIAGAATFSLLIKSGTNAATSALPHIGFTGTVDKANAATYDSAMVKSATRTISLRVTNADGNEVITKNISVFSVAGDRLYSTDDLLKLSEPKIMNLVQTGRTTFKDIHRRCQDLILAFLDKEGHVDAYGDKFTKDTLLDTEELQEWSTFMALRLIHEGRSNATNDIFHEKAGRYRELEKFHRERAVLRVDLDASGSVDDFEQTDIRSTVVVRR